MGDVCAHSVFVSITSRPISLTVQAVPNYELCLARRDAMHANKLTERIHVIVQAIRASFTFRVCDLSNCVVSARMSDD